MAKPHLVCQSEKISISSDEDFGLSKFGQLQEYLVLRVPAGWEARTEIGGYVDHVNVQKIRVQHVTNLVLFEPKLGVSEYADQLCHGFSATQRIHASARPECSHPSETAPPE